MTHEPECQHYIDDVSEKPRPSECMFCLIAKEAYQRGREEAAETILKSMWHEDDCISNRNPKTCSCAVGTAAEYARGDVEQA